MAYAKVILNGTTLIDLTDDTVTAASLLSTAKATKKDGVEVTGSIATKTADNLSVSGKTVTVPAGYYASQCTASVANGAYSASVSAHSVSTTPVVTGSISGTVTNIGTTTTPSGTDGTNYWTITPSGSVTTTGVSSAKGKATIGTAGYLATGNKESSASTVNITPTVSNGSARYIVKGAVTNSTTLPSGSSSSGTCSRGNYVKIGAGYYPSDLYYLAQNNSGTLTISETSDAATNISCNGYSNVNITGINIPAGKSFKVKVPNGSSTITFNFNVDSSGNVTITES